MSTILKALRRVEEGHGADQPKPALEGDWLGDGPDVARQPEPDEPRQPSRSLLKAWPMVASALAGFGLVLSGAWLWSQRPAEAVPTSPEPAAVVAAAVPAAEEQPIVDFAAAPVVPAGGSAEAVSGVQQQLREAAELAVESPPAAADPVVPEVEAPGQAPAAPTPTPLATIPEPAPEPTRSAAPPAAVARQAPARAPEPPPKPAAAKPDRTELVAVIPAPPEVRIVRTRWHPTPQKRTARVSIAGVVHNVRESDDIDGLRVVEIRPSTVVFLHEGVRIERKPGS